MATSALVSAIASLAHGTNPDVPPSSLVSVRQSHEMPWNAVAVDDRERYIVSAPKWSNNIGPAVAIAEKDGKLKPYPNASWNSWIQNAPAERKFVSVNAIHKDSMGDLWMVDTGSPKFGGTPVLNGAKVVRINPLTDTVVKVYIFPKDVLRPHSYIDDIRINGKFAYLTDAGEGAILVLDLENGAVRRRFDGMPFVQARSRDKIIVNGKILTGDDGRPLKVNADPLELSPDGLFFYFGPLTGPLSKIETRYLNDFSLDDIALAKHVSAWFEIPPIGGTAMAADGSLYYTPLADNSLMRRAPDGTITTIIRDKRLRWVDAPFLDGQGHVYLPVPQIDGAPIFNHGKSTVKFPVEIYRIDLPSEYR